MVELSDAWRVVLNALVEAAVAWQSPEEIAGTIECGIEETTDLLCDLDLAGWIEVWDGASGPLVTLSPLGAERMGVRLVEIGPDATPRWAPVSDPEPPAPPSTHVCASGRAASLDFVADSAPEPVEMAARSERAAAVFRAVAELRVHVLPRSPNVAGHPDDWPLPSLLLGVGLTPWPGPGQEPDREATCPVCGSRRLGPHMYCLYCDRWGLDCLLMANPGRKAASRPRFTPVHDPILEQLQGERLRSRRRAKRLKNQQLQLEAQRLRRRGQASPSGPKFPGGSGPAARPAS
jgi:hypothetical protein